MLKQARDTSLWHGTQLSTLPLPLSVRLWWFRVGYLIKEMCNPNFD
jgi:hypothetical protein